MWFVHRKPLLCRRLRNDTASAVEAGAIDDGRVGNHAAVLVHAVEAGADVHYRGVVSEGTTFPAPTVESDTAVTEAIIDSSVESDMRAPVARAPRISAPHKAPIAGRPQQSRVRRGNP